MRLILEKASENDENVIHSDYSENIQEKPKHEQQSMHFFEESFCLHCTVIHKRVY